jgi:hypothetical protein
MPTARNVTAKIAVNANVARLKEVDLNGSAEAAEVGTVPAASAPYIAVAEYGDNTIHKTILTCTALPLSIADDAGVAQYGGVQVYTFPLGLISTLMARIAGNLTLGVTGTIIAAFTGKNALGTVTASTGATLISTEATWLQETPNATASAAVAAISSISIATQLSEASMRTFDGRTTAAPMWLNFAIADDATHTAGTGTFTGTISFVWTKI